MKKPKKDAPLYERVQAALAADPTLTHQGLADRWGLLRQSVTQAANWTQQTGKAGRPRKHPKCTRCLGTGNEPLPPKKRKGRKP